MLKRYTLNEEMAKMKHLMLFEAGQPQQQAADPMASYNQTMQNWGNSLSQWQQQSPEDARAIQVALSAVAQGNPGMIDQAMRMTKNSNAQKMLQNYKKAYETYAKAYEKTSGNKITSTNNPLVTMGATRGINQRTLDQTASAETANNQAWNNLQTAKNAYSTEYDNQQNQWATGAQNAQNNYYANNSFTLPGVKYYDGKKVVTGDVAVHYDPQRKGYYYMNGADNKTRTWLTNDQVKGLSGNTGYTNYTSGATNAYNNAYGNARSAWEATPSAQTLQQQYDNSLANYNQASSAYTNALRTPMVNTWSPYSQQQASGQQQQAVGQQQAPVQPQATGQPQQQQAQPQQPQQQQTQQPQQQPTQPQTRVHPYGSDGSYVSVPTYIGNGPIKKQGIPKIMPASATSQQQ